jgi:preprotein translocase subunit SecE
MLKKVVLFVFAFFILDWGIGLLLEKGLFLYYGLGNYNKVALIGHSHLMLGVNKTRLEQELNQPISKYTREGVNVADRDLMIDQLLEKNPNLEYVIYGVDAWMFTGEGLSANSYKLFYPFMDQEEVAQFVKESTTLLDYTQHKWIKTSRYNEGLINSSFRGHLSNWSNYKLGKVDVSQLTDKISAGNFRRINSSRVNREIFQHSLEKLTSRGIQVILVYVPTISYYNHAEADKFKAELNYFQEIAQESNKIYYLEYLKGWEDAYQLFFDPIHLNPEGQEKFTSALVKDLKPILDEVSGL